MAIECVHCGEELSGEEAEDPRKDGDGDVMCDECYHDRHEFTCCLCENHEHVDHQHSMLVVFDAEEAFDSDDRERGYTAGVYRITGGPYHVSDYFSMGLDAHHLERIADLPGDTNADDEGHPCGHLCRDCRAKVAPRTRTTDA